MVEQILETVRRTDAGGLIIVSAFGNLAADVVARNQERFARNVMPALRAQRMTPLTR